ncbi:DNA-binding transcriptional response regulator, NtrC family, contains REC, AAA-type ATPase, and a Fis-type DNA-binding domains [Malonomonas rubra DSM 5091]|uniref:DNA-binding transcriptional response regulator, NtrC family, contains REC, AAA-type ATPase, and a Fis-type DNA-binding domains n=1 Tax=Malonomonas rubra DSM 5091 TaxID=1122189 RepID=A0A1M6IQH7_MALRU|nr:sigma-54 dependent transcriptional regulator [Malonomonas rubra]SHJ36746.1 DNA-binding transcriptional response regulator, NtrC family, contains REC, AAA-type ATPase, and a Fis-type DNA-binding domains [Malonomonas rubra DSM 5091]
MSDSQPRKPILIVDDEPTWINSLALSLKVSAGLNNVEKCSDSTLVPQLLEENSYSLALLDLTMPKLSGEELLELIAEKHPHLPVIIISGINQIETAIRCVKLGAEDFFVKTDERKRVVAGVQRVLEQSQLRQESRNLTEVLLSKEDGPAFNLPGLISNNPEMKKIFGYLQAISRSSEPVLITGESGVGKELIAKALHQVSCPDRPWVAVNVAGLDDTMFSDSLFGHVKGAYTSADQTRSGMIEQAQDGILFLDEIGDLSIASQIKLLRLIQEGEYYPLGSDKPRKIKARILVATNQDLQAKEAAGEFRRDLLYRLWAHRVAIPPLRERKEDIRGLLDHFLQEAAESMGKNVPTTPPELVPLLQTHNFPGNVRELRAMAFNAVSLHRRGVLSMVGFIDMLPTPSGKTEAVTLPEESRPQVSFNDVLPTIKQVNELLIEEAMKRSGDNQTLAARLLGISHQALSRRLKKNNE